MTFATDVDPPAGSLGWPLVTSAFRRLGWAASLVQAGRRCTHSCYSPGREGGGNVCLKCQGWHTTRGQWSLLACVLSFFAGGDAYISVHDQCRPQEDVGDRLPVSVCRDVSVGPPLPPARKTRPGSYSNLTLPTGYVQSNIFLYRIYPKAVLKMKKKVSQSF